MSQTYTDNAIPVSSRTVALKSGPGAGTSVGTYVAEDISIERGSQEIVRRDEAGKVNGWAVNATGDDTGTMTLQIAGSTTETPKIGYWFSDIFDLKAGATAEQWVIVKVGQPFRFDTYLKVTCGMRHSANPPAS
jgi:hypothetical protein